MDSHQADFAKERRTAMVKRVDKELSLAEDKIRTREAAADRETCKRPKLSHGAATVSAFQNVDEAAGALIGNGGFVAAYMPHVTLLGNQNTTQLTESSDELAAFEYNAPVHNQINWLPWVNQTET